MVLQEIKDFASHQESMHNNAEIVMKPMAAMLLQVPNVAIDESVDDVDEPSDLAPKILSRASSENDNVSIKSLQPMSIKRWSFGSKDGIGSQPMQQSKEMWIDTIQTIPHKNSRLCVIL